MIKATETYKKAIISKQVKKVIHRKPIPQRPVIIPVKKTVHRLVRERSHRDSQRVSKMQEEPFANFFRPETMRRAPTVLRIPDLALPPTVQNIRPETREEQIDLGKLNSLVKYPLVKTLECNGPNEKIVVTGKMGRRNTPVTLTKEEVESVISKFSESTKIPYQEGFFKVAFGRLMISAIISKIIGSKFIITKMADF